MHSSMNPALLIVTLTLVDVSIAEEAQKEPIKRGSPIGNTILLGLLGMGLLIYLWVQFMEKAKLSQVCPCSVHLYRRRSRGCSLCVTTVCHAELVGVAECGSCLPRLNGEGGGKSEEKGDFSHPH